MMRGGYTRLLTLFVLFGGAAAVIVSAQGDDPIRGICDDMMCGPPSASIPVDSFPTLTALDWGAFPAHPARPYLPGEGGRAFFVAPTGNDSYPGTQDSPLATINMALTLAQPGDVIWVARGEYAIGEPDTYEALILDTPGVTLAAWEIGSVTLVPSAHDPAIAIQARADDLIIDGFVICEFREAAIEYGRVESPQRDLVLKHLKIERTGEGVRSGYGGDGMQPIIDGMLVYDLWLQDITLIGLHCGQGPCNNLRWEALRIWMPSDENGDSGADGLAVESGDNVLVLNAAINGAEGDGIDLKSTRNVVANVIVDHVGRNGIKLWHGGDVINAEVTNTGADAALVFEAGDYRVINTLVARHNWGGHSYGMTVAYDSPSQPGRLELINSVFYQNAGAIWVSPAMTLSVHNSVFFGAGNGEELVYDPLIIGANGQPVSTLEEMGFGADNPGIVDPGFANPDAGQYQWGQDSPLLDAGTTAFALPAFDLTGAPRIVGQGVDIGPYESPFD